MSKCNVKDKNRVFVVNVKHDGIFSPYPFSYIHGDEKQLTGFDFEERNPNSWSRAFFDLNSKCASFENGIAESFNKAIIVQRTKLIITMLEDIRLYIMQRLVEMNKKAMNLEDRITPSIIKRLEILIEQQRGGGRGSRGGRGQATSGMGDASGSRGQASGGLGEASGALGEASGGRGQSNAARFQANTKRGESSGGRGRARGRYGRSGMDRGRGGRGQGRGGRGRGRGVTTMLVDEENMEHEYMEQILIEEEEKRIAAEKAIQEEFDEEAVRLTLEEEARYEKENQAK
ncbi:hypothetical protein Tco_0758731 [Tanacetum coccineum]